MNVQKTQSHPSARLDANESPRREVSGARVVPSSPDPDGASQAAPSTNSHLGVGATPVEHITRFHQLETNPRTAMQAMVTYSAVQGQTSAAMQPILARSVPPRKNRVVKSTGGRPGGNGGRGSGFTQREVNCLLD